MPTIQWMKDGLGNAHNKDKNILLQGIVTKLGFVPKTWTTQMQQPRNKLCLMLVLLWAVVLFTLIFASLIFFVDPDHADEDKQTRRSRTGFIVYLNTALIPCYSTKQATIKASIFGTEFVTMKNEMEYLQGLRCMVQMLVS